MVEIKCQILDLQKVCKLVGLHAKTGKGSGYAMNDFVMDCQTGNTVFVCAGDPTSSLFVKLQYFKINVVVPGKIAIGDISQFEEYLKRFDSGEFVNVKAENGQLIIVGINKTIKTILAAEENITSAQGGIKEVIDRMKEDTIMSLGSTQLPIHLTFKAEEIVDVVNDACLVNQMRFPFKVKKTETEEQFIIELGEDKSTMIKKIIPTIEIKINYPLPNDMTQTQYGFGVSHIFSNLDGVIDAYLDTDAPIWIKKIDKNFKVDYLLAPLVSDQ